MFLAEWDRDFTVFSYAFSYSRLLLRSTPAFDQDLRVDVVFSNVEHMNIPTRLSRLAIEEADFESERGRLTLPEIPSKASRLFLVNGGPFCVVATRCQWHEDHEWADAPTHFAPFRGVNGAEF